MTTFADLGVPADLVAALSKRGVTEPFPVQAATIIDGLAGRDVCGKAPTGSGKTLAFGIPLVVKVRAAAPKKPRALVLAPTRELAAQIQKELLPLAEVRNKRVTTVYGGVGYEGQKKALRRGVEILVACPGRLRDLIDQGAVRLDGVEIVVIDEADRMADMGFLPEVRKLLNETSKTRQTVLFSATLDGDVAKLTAQYQTDPVTHEVAGVETDAADVDHHFELLEITERLERTRDLIRQHGPTIVFTRTRHGAEKLAKQLRTVGIDSAPIHGGLTQGKRDRALEGFKSYKVEALIATDVAARGIHVDGVSCVIHYDPPVDTKTYIHRSGRTARAGATGTVVSFIASDQRKASRKMQEELGLVTPEARSSEPRSGAPRNRGGEQSRGGSGQSRHGGSGGGSASPRGRRGSASRQAGQGGGQGSGQGQSRRQGEGEGRDSSRTDGPRQAVRAGANASRSTSSNSGSGSSSGANGSRRQGSANGSSNSGGARQGARPESGSRDAGRQRSDRRS